MANEEEVTENTNQQSEAAAESTKEFQAENGKIEDSPIECVVYKALEAGKEIYVKALHEHNEYVQNKIRLANVDYQARLCHTDDQGTLSEKIKAIDAESNDLLSELKKEMAIRKTEIEAVYVDTIKKVWSEVDTTNLDIHVLKEISRIFWVFSTKENQPA